MGVVVVVDAAGGDAKPVFTTDVESWDVESMGVDTVVGDRDDKHCDE